MFHRSTLSVRSKTFTVILAWGLIAIFTFMPQIVHSAKPIELRVGEVEAEIGATEVSIPVYLQMLGDTLNSFVICLQIGQQDIVSFIGIETENSLLADWQYVTYSMFPFSSTYVKVEGVAEFPAFPVVKALVGPLTSDLPMFRVVCSVNPAIAPSENSSADVFINHDLLDCFSLNDPHGYGIGTMIDTVIDSSFYLCSSWLPPPNEDVCVSWERVVGPPYDSLLVEEIVVTIPVDPDYYEFTQGSVRIVPPCGDIDGSFDRVVDISDLTRMIDYLFISNIPLVWESRGNVNASIDGVVDIGDLTALIGYLFITFEPPACLPLN